MRYANILPILALLFAAGGQLKAAETYQVDPGHSSATFKVKHFNISYVTGRFDDISGKIVVDSKNPPASSVEISIKTASINTNNEKRDKHLRNEDFFDVGKYPIMGFKSKKAKKLDDGTYEVTGDFSLHGVTKTITVPVRIVGEGDVSWGGHHIGFETRFRIKRSDYGMNKLIPAAGDQVEILITVEAIRKDAPIPELSP